VITVASVQGLELFLSSSADECTSRPGRTFGEIAFEIPGAPIALGVHTIIGDSSIARVPAEGEATATYATVKDCQGGGSDQATSGSITVSSATPGEVSGSFDLTFPDGHLTGTFDAPICDVDAAAIHFDCP
jgi:hypothetical protein